MFRTKRRLGNEVGLGLVFRLVRPWLLYRLVWLLEESVLTGVLVDCCEYSSSDVAPLMPYVDLSFSGCMLVITVITGCKQWLNNAVMRRFVPNILVLSMLFL